MWTNPNTGKGWTDDEETAFLDIQQVSRLNRIQAIQLFKRFKCNKTKALEVAKRIYSKPSEAKLASAAQARATLSHKRQQQRAKAQGGT